MSHVGRGAELIHRILWVWTSVTAWVLWGVGNGWRLVWVNAIWTAMLGTLALHEGSKVLLGAVVCACGSRTGRWYRDAVWLRSSADHRE